MCCCSTAARLQDTLFTAVINGSLPLANNVNIQLVLCYYDGNWEAVKKINTTLRQKMTAILGVSKPSMKSTAIEVSTSFRKNLSLMSPVRVS